MTTQDPKPPIAESKPPRTFGQKLRTGCLFVGVILLVALYCGKLWWDATFFWGYEPSLPLLAEVTEKSETNGHMREKIKFQSERGEMIPATFHYPKGATSEVPCLVLMYGIGQDMKFLDEIAEPYIKAGFAILCPEQFGRGERKGEAAKEGFKAVMSFKTRLSKMVIDARRAADYLDSRPEIDHKRMALFGVSLGAIVGTSALAMEPRYTAGLLMWGGGDMPKIFNQGQGAKLGTLAKIAAKIGNYFLEPAEPMLRIGLVAPRPILFQNALNDEIIPKVCTEEYYEKAGQPKEILWYECGHEKGLTREIIFKIIDDQIAWLKKNQNGKTG
jgi:dienelactone hydrolase